MTDMVVTMTRAKAAARLVTGTPPDHGEEAAALQILRTWSRQPGSVPLVGGPMTPLELEALDSAIANGDQWPRTAALDIHRVLIATVRTEADRERARLRDSLAVPVAEVAKEHAPSDDGVECLAGGAWPCSAERLRAALEELLG